MHFKIIQFFNMIRSDVFRVFKPEKPVMIRFDPHGSISDTLGVQVGLESELIRVS